MTRKPQISPDEAAEFRDAVGAIAELPRSNRAKTRRPTPSSRPRQSQKDEREVITHLLDHPIEPMMLETGDEVEYRQDGVQLSIMRKLRRGQYARQDELDLHGMTVAQAREQVIAFLGHARAHNMRCVRVIHGKGLRSTQRGPVLKPRVSLWLRQRKEVLAYCSATLAEGGTGAVYVLLRR